MYAFACGYIQTVGGEKEHTKSAAYLYLDSMWHVRRPLEPGETYHMPMGWDTYESLTEARSALRKYGPFTNHRDGGTLDPKVTR